MPVTHTLVSALPDNAADAAAGLVVSSNWNDSHAIDSIEITGGTVTASTPLIDATQTWNNGAVTFTAQKVNVTDTASVDGSLLADWQVGGVSRAHFTKKGRLALSAPAGWGSGSEIRFYSNAGANAGLFQLDSSGNFVFRQSQSDMYFDFFSAVYFRSGAALDIVLTMTGAVTEFRKGTTAQTLRVYGTYTDTSNYVRASLASSSTAVTLAAQTAGTGADNVPVNITPAGTEGVGIGNFAQFTEMTAPAAGAANTARLFCEDNGAGKTRLMVQFASGSPVQVAIEV